MKITLVFLLLTTILQRAFSVDNYDNEHIHAWLDNYHAESEVSFSEEEKKTSQKNPPLPLYLKIMNLSENIYNWAL